MICERQIKHTPVSTSMATGALPHMWARGSTVYPRGRGETTLLPLAVRTLQVASAQGLFPRVCAATLSVLPCLEEAAGSTVPPHVTVQKTRHTLVKKPTNRESTAKREITQSQLKELFPDG